MAPSPSVRTSFSGRTSFSSPARAALTDQERIKSQMGKEDAELDIQYLSEAVYGCACTV